MTTATLTFDKAEYGPVDVITFRVSVDAPMDAQSRPVEFTGTVKVPLFGELPITGSATLVEPAGTYGPFTAGGYTVVQDPADPSLFHATPA